MLKRGANLRNVDAGVIRTRCFSIGRDALPTQPETVALYVADLAARGRRPATIARKLATVVIYHKVSGFDPPTARGVVRDVERGYRRKLGVGQQQKTALMRDPLLVVSRAFPTICEAGAIARSSSSGWAAALRRSEIAALGVRTTSSLMLYAIDVYVNDV